MTSATNDRSLLRVARPSECNTQQSIEAAEKNATANVTTAQHGSLKALALLAIARNSPCNNPRNNAPNSVQQTDSMKATIVAHDSANIRAHLHSIAADAGLPASVVTTLDDDDMTECDGLSDPTLRDWLRLRASCPICCPDLVRKPTLCPPMHYDHRKQIER
jgi:hypothetical protein